jgi:hypothetical protein
MPKYRRRRQSRWNGFTSQKHLVHFLLKQGDGKLFKEHFQDRAKRWLDGTEKPLHRVTRRALKIIANTHPHHIAQDVMSDAKQHLKGEDVGGGVTEALQSLSRATWNFWGIPKILEWFGHKAYTTKPIPKQAQVFAVAVEETYLPVEERALHLYGMTRLPEYDSDRCSVWKQSNGELFVSVHGTSLVAKDLADDARILAGKENVRDPEVEALITKLVNSGARIDVGGHSLATAFLTNLPMEIQEQIDEVYLFNPASSPFMDNKYLDEITNKRDNYVYFLNPSDVVSSGIYNKITKESIEDHAYIGHYKWSLLGAHDVMQWAPDLKPDDKEAWTPDENESYRAHLMGMAKLQARAEQEAEAEGEAGQNGG